MHVQRLGVKLDLLKFCQPSSGDEALDIAAHLAGSGGVDIIVIDSVAALIPKSELDGDIGQPTVSCELLGACRAHARAWILQLCVSACCSCPCPSLVCRQGAGGWSNWLSGTCSYLSSQGAGGTRYP